MPDQLIIERLEAVVGIDKAAAKTKSELEKLRAELRGVKAELKELKALDPKRLKKNLAEIKKKLAVKNSEISSLNKETLALRKGLRETKAELIKSQNETDSFYVSPCKQWSLILTGFQFADEAPNPDEVRVRCLDQSTGTSVVAVDIDGDQITWSSDIGVPDEIGRQAAERINQLKLTTRKVTDGE
jgi:hypothetical protein